MEQAVKARHSFAQLPRRCELFNLISTAFAAIAKSFLVLSRRRYFDYLIIFIHHTYLCIYYYYLILGHIAVLCT